MMETFKEYYRFPLKSSVMPIKLRHLTGLSLIMEDLYLSGSKFSPN